MNSLTKALIEGLIDENESFNGKIVGMFGGGFKPPTIGHLEVVQKALSDYPEMDELIVLVGSGVRNSISQEESLAIWDIYKKSLPSKVKIMASPKNKPPIGAIYSYAKKNPNERIYWFLGEREGNEGDAEDIVNRTKSLRKLVYQNVKVKKIVTGGAVSGTKARQAVLNKDKEAFLQYIPDIPETDEIWDMLTNVVKEQYLQERIAYDAETRMQTRFLMKQFLKTIGTKVEDSTEGTLVGKKYELEYGFYPMKKGLGFMPFKVEGSAGPKDIAIEIKYNPELLDKKLYSELSAELRNSVRHELEHFAQYHAEKGVRPGEDGVNQDDLPDVEYLTLDYEIPGHIQGLRTKAKAKKISLQQAIDDLFDSAEYDLDLDEEDFVRETWMNWLKTNMPGVSLTKIKEGSAIPKNVNPDELRKGIEVEKEHTDNPKIALKIALDHLKEDPKYYTKLATLGLEEGPNIKEEQLDEGVDLINDLINSGALDWLIEWIYSDRFKYMDIESQRFIAQLENETWRKEFSDSDAFKEFRKMLGGSILYSRLQLLFQKGFPLGNKEKTLQTFEKLKNHPVIGRIGKAIINTIAGTPLAAEVAADSFKKGYSEFFNMMEKAQFIKILDNMPNKIKEKLRQQSDEILKSTQLSEVVANEYLDQQDVQDLDRLADTELNPIDIDLSGNHFFDRLNDPRNAPEIDYLELEDFFTKLGDNREEFIDFLNKYKSVVATDIETNINIPFMKMANKAIAKTIMRKRNFQTPDVKVELEEEVPQDVINSFDIQDTLVPEVWDNEQLKPEVREKLLQIAQDFFDSLELPKGTKLKDIKLTGSLANYNWSKFSDFDLHLVLDFSEIDDDEEFVRNYFMAKKGIWNDAHDITIYGFPVEIYVENEGESHTASGLYSILNDEWIVIPKKQEVMIDKDDISTKAEDYISQTEEVQKLYDEGKYEEVIIKVDKIKERLRNMRSSGLEKGGEYSVENLAFKVLRRSDIIGLLNDLKSQSYDTIMTLSENISPEDLNLNIISLTQYMGNNGLDLKPYPKVKLIKNDIKNAEDLLGKTAYYDPNAQLVVLYTMGRHPKDILRSYAHELIHHHQNLSGTLQPFQTTNTNEDSNLDGIERQAYEEGNILFRNWEDQIKNEK